MWLLLTFYILFPVHFIFEDTSGEGLWRLFAGTFNITSNSLKFTRTNVTLLMTHPLNCPVCFADVYLCAVLICSLGLLSIFLFTLVLICQCFYQRHRLKSIAYFLHQKTLLSPQTNIYLLLLQPVIFLSSVQKAGKVCSHV